MSIAKHSQAKKPVIGAQVMTAEDIGFTNRAIFAIILSASITRVSFYFTGFRRYSMLLPSTFFLQIKQIETFSETDLHELF